MNLNEYQKWTRETAIYPKESAITYLGLGLSSEAGEVAGKVKKIIRDGGYDGMALLQEVGDVFWYAVRLCDEVGIDAETVLRWNKEKLTDRLSRNVIKGSGDDR